MNCFGLELSIGGTVEKDLCAHFSLVALLCPLTGEHQQGINALLDSERDTDIHLFFFRQNSLHWRAFIFHHVFLNVGSGIIAKAITNQVAHLFRLMGGSVHIKFPKILFGSKIINGIIIKKIHLQCCIPTILINKNSKKNPGNHKDSRDR